MESLRATQPIRLPNLVLIPIQRLDVRELRTGGVFVTASATPEAIVVSKNGCWNAMDLNGTEIALEPLLKKVSGLSDFIATGKFD